MSVEGGRGRAVLRWSLVVLYLAAGVVHLVSPGGFLPIVPDWVPWPREVVLATGVCEIAGAVGLATRRFRRIAGIMLALYAVGVFPANVHHAFGHVVLGGTQLGWGYHAPRLLLQPVLVWAALYAGGAISWPFRPRRLAGRAV